MRLFQAYKDRAYCHGGSEYDPIDHGIDNIVQDAFINSYCRNSQGVVSDFPEWYYVRKPRLTEPQGHDIWLCWEGEFPAPQGHSGMDYERYQLLNWVRTVRTFNDDSNLSQLARLYWLLKNDKDQGGSGGANDGQGQPGPGVELITDDASQGGKSEPVKLPDQKEDIDNQQKADKQAFDDEMDGCKAGQKNQDTFIADTQEDIDLSQIFDVKTPEMEAVLRMEDRSEKLRKAIDGIVQQTRGQLADVTEDISIPTSITTHDMAMMGMFGDPPVQWEHKLDAQEDERAKWHTYIDFSVSTAQEQPLAKYISNRMEGLVERLWGFSTYVAPYDGGCWVRSSGGTNYLPVFQHAKKKGVNNLMVIGDAECGFCDIDTLPRDLQIWMKTHETFMVLTKARPRTLSRARRTFKYVYCVSTDTLYQRGRK
jgi:hypothetical protein